MVQRVDRLPVRQRRATQRIYREREPRSADRIYVDYVLEIAHIGQDEIFLMGRGGVERCFVAHTLYARVDASEQRVCPLLNPMGHVGIGWAAVRGIVLDAAVLRRI